MKKNGFSLVEIMFVLGALGGIALVVTKMGSNSMNIKNEATIANDYNDLVRESHFLIANSKACKVSLAGINFTASDKNLLLTDLELWSSDSKGEKRIKKKISKGEKFGSLQVDNVSLDLDPAPADYSGENLEIKNTTAIIKISVVKPKVKNSIVDIEHSISVNYSISKTSGESTIVDCGEKQEKKENTIWCGSIQNPCGSEVFPAVAIGSYKNGKFTGIFQPTGIVEGKICTGAVNHPATLTACVSQ